MASLQARHTRMCAIGRPWTTFEAATEGCTCKGGPSYYVVVRDGTRLERERVGKNRQQAERALRKIGSKVDEGAYVPQKKIRFDAWADRWLASLERKPSTIYSYGKTMAIAKRAFGNVPVRRLNVDHVKLFLEKVGEERESPTGVKRRASSSTRAKHLRVLGVCLASAVRSGYAGRNPVRDLAEGERPQKRLQEAAYFTNDELPVLFAQFRERGVYALLFESALKTGMRQGELLALRWGDVDLVHGVIHVRRSFTGCEEVTPKNHEKREVFIADELVDRLGAWWGELGKPGDDKLVFPGETKTGYLNPQVILRRELYPAMTRAGVDRVGPTGEKRTFHSFRHTFAKLAIENGRPIFWLSKHLGHSSLDITAGVYGHFERETRQREARQMEGVFGV